MTSGVRPHGAIAGLDDVVARDAARAGAKAANLAVSRQRGLPVLPGFVVTTAATAGGRLAAGALGELRDVWADIGGRGEALVVRSSSTVEDVSTSSMAGQFTTVLGVAGWDAFLDAVATVLASAAHPAAGGPPAPMAVLVQPQVDAACGGVLFGVDPVTGNAHRLVVDAVPCGPDMVVSGRALPAHVVMTRHGRRVSAAAQGAPDLLTRSRRRALARLARRAAAVFGGPQDVEWAFDPDGYLWLLQSRPVTAVAAAPQGDVLGPGPVAETFPDPLRPLEVDLWVEPLRRGIVGALHTIGVHGPRRVERSPVVTVIGGRVAADLGLFGAIPRGRRSFWRALDPVGPARRLVAAWRVGRLRAALPALAGSVVTTVDEQLASVPAVGSLTDAELLELVAAARELLASVHGHEVLAGMLLGDTDQSGTVAGLAIEALGAARREGLTDGETIARDPVVLALVPPSLTVPPALPDAGGAPAVARFDVGPREALRLRARWVQELVARAALDIGRRLGIGGRVAEMTWAEVRAAITRGELPADLDERRFAPGPELPTWFRCTDTGEVVAITSRAGAGLGASSGRASGVVGADVLVVETLDPRLAAALPRLAALVSETGSPLSHLAILAREMHVPTVVGVADARRRFPSGTEVVVDGSTGEVTVVNGGSG